MAKKENKKTIDPNATISEIAENHPEVADYLVEEYGFHCTHCFLNEFESFEDGASVHGIYGDDFDELLKEVNELIEKKSDE
jgi:hybrid cluster-associated redox disulfide protein